MTFTSSAIVALHFLLDLLDVLGHCHDNSSKSSATYCTKVAINCLCDCIVKHVSSPLNLRLFSCAPMLSRCYIVYVLYEDTHSDVLRPEIAIQNLWSRRSYPTLIPHPIPFYPKGSGATFLLCRLPSGQKEPPKQAAGFLGGLDA